MPVWWRRRAPRPRRCGGTRCCGLGGWRSGDRAVAEITGADPGRGYRQLAALDPQGGTAAFTGDASVAYRRMSGRRDGRRGEHAVGSRGSWTPCGGLDGSDARGTRLCARWRRCAGGGSGGDARGLLSAALLVCGRMRPRSICASTGATRPCDDLARPARRGADTALCRLAGGGAGGQRPDTGRCTGLPRMPPSRGPPSDRRHEAAHHLRLLPLHHLLGAFHVLERMMARAASASPAPAPRPGRAGMAGP
jgi:hypothetical protein